MRGALGEASSTNQEDSFAVSTKRHPLTLNTIDVKAMSAGMPTVPLMPPNTHACAWGRRGMRWAAVFGFDQTRIGLDVKISTAAQSPSPYIHLPLAGSKAR